MATLARAIVNGHSTLFWDELQQEQLASHVIRFGFVTACGANLTPDGPRRSAGQQASATQSGQLSRPWG